MSIFLPSILSQGRTPDEAVLESGEESNAVEQQVVAAIVGFWRRNGERSSARKLASKELKEIRQKLASKLSEYKRLLARPGRNGDWSAFLREHGIPRATADRYVKTHERDQHLAAEGSERGEVEASASEAAKKFLHKLLPVLRPELRTAEARAVFFEELTTTLV